MDGKLMLDALENLINEESGSAFLDTFTSYNFLNEAAYDLNSRIHFLKADQTITTVANQSDYTLNADYQVLYRRDTQGRYFAKYSDGTTKYNIKQKSEDSFVLNDTSETDVTQLIPDAFAITDDQTLDARVTGTATITTALSNGESTLNGAGFGDVSAGGSIHNITTDSLGVVLEKTSASVLITSLFRGSNASWTLGDAYVIQPQGRYKLVLDPTPSESGHTITLPYVKRPEPVYADYRMFRLPNQYKDALKFKAASLYAYKNAEPNFGDRWLNLYEKLIRENAHRMTLAERKNRVVVNFKKRPFSMQ